MRFTATLPDNISFAPGSPARQARTWGTKAEGPHSAARITHPTEMNAADQAPN